MEENTYSSIPQSNKRISKENVIAKLKDDGDFDRLRLKIIRRIKDNEELRNNIISVVKQSAALNRAGAENLKPRQLSDAIFEEVGDKVMSQISDGLWGIIRSEDGMKSEITETVQLVYNKLVNPAGEVNGEPSTCQLMPNGKGSDIDSTIVAPAGEVKHMISDSDPKEPPGFTLSNNDDFNNIDKQPMQISMPHGRVSPEDLKEKSHHLPDVHESDDVDHGVPPGFSGDTEQKQACDGSDEDPDVPPGFG